jgi:hypothetical protein
VDANENAPLAFLLRRTSELQMSCHSCVIV